MRFSLLRSGIVFLLLSCGMSARATATEDRVLVLATINKKPVTLAFDTGAETLILFAKVAARLDIAIVQKPPPDAVPEPGKVLMAVSEECDVVIPGVSTFRSAFRVVQEPMGPPPDIDGLIGWGALQDKFMLIDMSRKSLQGLQKLPEDRAGWVKAKMRPEGVLLLELPMPGASSSSLVFVDSGMSYGVQLAPEKWREWRAEHAKQPASMTAWVSPYSGLIVSEEQWADKFSLGPLEIDGVPVAESDRMGVTLGAVATIGMAALKRVELLIDREKGEAWLRPVKTPAPAYNHNRLGAVFTPAGPQGEDLLAHVAAGSPAAEAGIRDGDVLLKIGALDATKWRTDPQVLPLSRFWQRAAGTKFDLGIRRGSEVIHVNVTLRDILPPTKAGN